MSEELQSLLEKINREGVEKAQARSGEIIAEAEAEAKRLVAAAQKEAAQLQAGVDIILMPEGLSEAFDAVIAAVENGTISESRLNESVYRVLQYKQLYGIIKL